MITIDEAREQILARVEALPTEYVGLDEAGWRTLAEPLVARDPLPLFDNSAMDGYAVNAADTVGATAERTVVLTVRGDAIAAGARPSEAVAEGEARRIMTGAPMPEGADAVVMVEQTIAQGSTIRVSAGVIPGQNVRYAGEDIEAGTEALAPGTLFRAPHVALAAALGYATVRVYRRPKVAIIATGDELVEPGEPLGPGQIRNSNAYAIAAQVQAAGGIAVRLPIARDTAADVRTALAGAAAQADVIVSTGGVSVGDYDVVRDVLASVGEMVFWSVAVKPGKPLAFGIIRGRPFFGVPGNPSASIISFEMFIRPALLKMQGRTSLFRPTATCILDEPISNAPGRTNLIRAVVEQRADKLRARPVGAQGSAILSSLAAADALLVVPAEVASLAEGHRVTAILLREEEA